MILERVLDFFFEYQLILGGCDDQAGSDRSIYLKRYFLVKNDEVGLHPHLPRLNLTVHRAGNRRQLFIHKICRSDEDLWTHDHPWSFTSLILWRGYYEETFKNPQAPVPVRRKLDRKYPGMILNRKAEHRHRVLLDEKKGPAWTLVWTSGKKRSWGWWVQGNFIPWRLFLRRNRCHPQEESR